MELFEKRIVQVRSDIKIKLDTFEDLFTQELAKKLSECGPCFLQCGQIHQLLV